VHCTPRYLIYTPRIALALRPAVADEPDRLARFSREAQVRADGTAKVLHFGLAKAMDRM